MKDNSQARFRCYFSPRSPATLLDISTCNFQESGGGQIRIIRTQMGLHNDHKWSQRKGRLVRPLRNSNGTSDCPGF
jgi:hypothetical protein